MITSPTTTSPSKPSGDDRVPVGDLAYFQARNKNRVYDIVIKEFLESGITQAQLARRLGKGTDRVCKILGAPGNWTLDTVSDLMFAISGAELEYAVSPILDRSVRNSIESDWMSANSGSSAVLLDVPQNIPPTGASEEVHFVIQSFGQNG